MMDSNTRDIQDFVYYLTHSKSLTRIQQLRRDKLLVRDISVDLEESNNKRVQKKDKNRPTVHFPKKTATFLSLFGRRDGFKYLTHKYDNQNMDFDVLISQAKKVYEDYRGKDDLPNSLKALVHSFIYGGEWIDYKGDKHKDGYSSSYWREWSLQNEGKHPMTDIGGIETVIQLFRHTIRLVAPDLQDFFDNISKSYPSFNFTTKNLGMADYYTNVFIMNQGITNIIKDLCDHDNFKNIIIEYIPNFEVDDFVTHIIRISQIGSFSYLPIERVIDRFNEGNGFLADNARLFSGYCNWAVESYWNGIPFRWNILSDNNVKTIEPLKDNLTKAFTHILTFYSK